MLKPLTVMAALGAVLALGACDTTPKAPTDKGICYSVGLLRDGKVKFNKVAENQPTLEACIARLEELRIKFLRMGGSHRDLIGAYQGKYLFIDASGVAIADGLKSGRFYAFTRSPTGELALPNVVNQPAPGAGPGDTAPPAEGPEQK
ncbi:MAG: hypothetical protein K1X35_03450 [Caulobacteraceae bacterium]|nr:hypothetical protein [Caulobacteraceae bacterium]